MKNIRMYLAIAAISIFMVAHSAFAETFDLPSPVYVSGNVSGLLSFKSDNPVALNMIQGIVQFRNDIMKRNGTGRNRNVYCEAVRVSPCLLTVQMYQQTLSKQFAFNVKNGPLWGNIPSCYLIPDGITVIIEDSYPINKGEEKDSENGLGGHHFSLIAHLVDRSLVNPVAFDVASCGGHVTQAAYVVPTPAPVPPKYERIKERRKGPCPDGKGICSQECIVEIRAGVKYLVESVGMWTKDEPVGERTLQQKARITLDVSRETKAAVGQATPEEKKAGLGTLHKKSTKIIKQNEKTHKMIGHSKRDKKGKHLTVHGNIDGARDDIQRVEKREQRIEEKVDKLQNTLDSRSKK